MKIVGLTGGIGSGKSYISNLFSTLGVSIYDSDSHAKELCNNDETIKKSVIEVFGEESYKEGLYNRKYIANIVFNNSELLNKLNSIIHPVLEKHFDNWCAERANESYIIKESAILFETGIYKKMDYVILVTAPENIRIERVMKRDNLSYEQVKNRMKNMWSDIEKEKLTDFLIPNDGVNNILKLVNIIHIALK